MSVDVHYDAEMNELKMRFIYSLYINLWIYAIFCLDPEKNEIEKLSDKSS